MDNLGDILRSMSFDFWGSGQHKIEMDALLATKEAVFLDVRAKEEWDSIQIKLEHHIRVLWIPTCEIPDRYKEIPRDKTVGIFCSAGSRSNMVYLYLRSLGFENVRVATSNYDALTSLLLPGKLHKAIAMRKAEKEKG
jgi:rhodanese-related sulfurtransferase